VPFFDSVLVKPSSLPRRSNRKEFRKLCARRLAFNVSSARLKLKLQIFGLQALDFSVRGLAFYIEIDAT